MRTKINIFFLILSLCMIHGCGTSKKEIDKSQLLSCGFRVRSLSRPTLAGTDLSKGVNFTVVSRIGSLLSGNPSSVPLDFTINLAANNPNALKVVIQEVEYILRIDNIHLASGKTSKPVTIAADKTQGVPVPISIDLATLLRSNSAATVQNMVKNFIETGSRKTNVTLQIKPTYRIGKEVIESPRYVPLNFSFGG